MSELGVEPVEEPRGGDEQPLHERREQDEGHWNPDDSVDDAEDLAALRQRVHVAIAWRIRVLFTSYRKAWGGGGTSEDRKVEGRKQRELREDWEGTVAKKREPVFVCI